MPGLPKHRFRVDRRRVRTEQTIRHDPEIIGNGVTLRFWRRPADPR